MIVKENERSFQLKISKKSQIKYVVILIFSSLLLFFFCLSMYVLFSGKILFLGNTISDLLVNLTFFIGGNIVFFLLSILGIYGALKILLVSKKIIFNRSTQEALFITKRQLFKKDSLKKIPFSEIFKLIVKQEQDSEYITLSILQENKRFIVDSAYNAKGMERLNALAERIQKFTGVPLQKGQFEDIYEIEEEADKEKEQNKNYKDQKKGKSN